MVYFLFILVVIIYCRVSVTVFGVRVIQSEPGQDFTLEALTISNFPLNFYPVSSTLYRTSSS